MTAPSAARPSAAMRIDVEQSGDRSGIDERTYELLEHLWSEALRRAEAAAAAAAPHADESVGAHRLDNDEVSASALEAPQPQADTTRLASAPRAGENAMASSPLPRAPPVLAVTTQSPAQVHQHERQPQQQRPQQRQPVLRRPMASSRTPWMKVEAQPNLKRNGYTSHKGVAWVVQ